jgi:hypothetical protein
MAFASVEPGTYVRVKTEMNPLVSAGLQIPCIMGTGSILKKLSYTVTRGTVVSTADLIKTAAGVNVSRLDIAYIDSIVDNKGRSYTDKVDFKLNFETAGADEGTATIDWNTGVSGAVQPEISTSGIVSTYTVTAWVFKTTTDYAPRAVSDAASVADFYGEIELPTISSYDIVHGAPGSTDTVAALDLPADMLEILYIADATRFYMPGIDFISNAPVRGYYNSSDEIIRRTGTVDLEVDWSPSYLSDDEPAGVYRIYFTSTTTNAQWSGYSIPLAYNLMSQNGTNYCIIAQQNPLENGSGSQLVTPIEQGLSGFGGSGVTAGMIKTSFDVMLTAIYSRSDVQILVPMVAAHKGSSDGSVVATATLHQIIDAVKLHVNNASSLLEGRPRWALMGAPVGTNAPGSDVNLGVDVFRTTASTIKNERIGYNNAELVYSFTFGDLTLDGSYVSAQLAGLNGNPLYDAGEPISGKTLVGGTVNDVFTRFQKNLMMDSGVLIIYDNNGTATVRQFLSTDVTGVLQAELKVVKIKDTVRTALQQSLNGAYINTRYNGPETLARIKSSINMILDGFKAKQVIVNYNVASVTQNAGDAREIDVSLAIQPALDVNYILIDFTVKMSM